MDVGCPKCRAEYELDDARVPDDGVTVKCTNCGHIFRVKRKPPTVTPALRSGVSGPLPPAPPSREWKIRQPGGNVYACRELTALQKWIVEGKVTRADEISLTGDTWKRLGDIPELASFFQVFEEAKRARAIPPPAPTPSGQAIVQTWREPQFSLPAPAAPGPGDIRETMRDPQFSVPPPPPPPPPVAREGVREAVRPQATRTPAVSRERPTSPPAHQPSDEALARSVRRGSGGKWMVLVVLGLAVGGGLGWYFGIHVPAERQAAEERAAAAAAPRETPPTPTPPPEDVAVEDAGADDTLAAVETPPTEVEAVDAGAPEVVVEAPVDAGAAPVAQAPPAEPPVAKSFQTLLAQADRLRDREKPEQALQLYEQAQALKPEQAEPVTGRGLALLDLGRLPAAQQAFKDALKLNGRYGPAIMGLAEAYRLDGKNDDALEFYRRYLEVLPNGAEAAVARNNIERLSP